MRKLFVIILATIMLFSVASSSMATVNMAIDAIYYLDTARKVDEAHSEESGMDKTGIVFHFNSRVNENVRWFSKAQVASSDVGWNVVLWEAYADVRTDFGEIRFGKWVLETEEMALFMDSAFGRMEGWLALGYTSPDLGLTGLKFSASYYPDGQKFGVKIPAPAPGGDEVPPPNGNVTDFKDGAYVATLKYTNDWLTADVNLVETKIKDAETGNSGGSTLNLIAQTPLEGLRTILYMGEDKAERETQVVGLWYDSYPFTFWYETDLKDDLKNPTGGNRYAFGFGYKLLNGVDLIYRYRFVDVKRNEFIVSMKIR